MDRERIVQVFFFGFLALMAYELYRLLNPFIVPIAWAILLAFLAHPALIETNRLVKSRTLAAVIITFVVALGVILPAIWLSGRLVVEAQMLYRQVSAAMGTDAGASKLHEWTQHSELIAAIDSRLAGRGIKIEDQVPKVALQSAQVTSQYVVTNLGSAAHSVLSFLIDFSVVLFTFFYLLRDGEEYYENLRALTPLHEEDKAAVFETLRATLSSVMRGLMLTALLQGVSIGLGLLVCGVPYWAFLALATVAGGLLPIGGTAIVWVPAAMYLAYAQGWAPAIVLVVWCSIAVGVIDNFIKPLAMKHGTGLPTLALFFGIAGGLEVYGPLGLFAGPAIIAVFTALLRVYRKTYGQSRKEAA
ncbi:MAG TPA: AI-2E family transporter [Candidatus Binataceae bacterium]|jgi:predicted PurR-regulated permease PerM